MAISLDDMSALARALLDADAEVDKAAGALSAITERARQLREEAIPSAMQELGLSELKLDTGQKLTVKQDVYAAIPTDKKAAAFSWLSAKGFGGLIKTEVKTLYGKGEIALAQELVRDLQQRGLSAELSESVHAQTLKAFLREQIAAGAVVPLELFGARPVWTAKITGK